MFPDETTNDTDPASFKVEKDASLSVDAVHQQSVYVVLTSTQPYEGQLCCKLWKSFTPLSPMGIEMLRIVNLKWLKFF